jgi:hypothetical protein
MYSKGMASLDAVGVQNCFQNATLRSECQLREAAVSLTATIVSLLGAGRQFGPHMQLRRLKNDA